MNNILKQRLEHLLKTRADATKRGASLNAGLSESALKKMLYTEEPNPRINTLQQLAAYFGVSVGYLIGETDDNGNIMPFHGIPLFEPGLYDAIAGELHQMLTDHDIRLPGNVFADLLKNVYLEIYKEEQKNRTTYEQRLKIYRDLRANVRLFGNGKVTK